MASGGSKESDVSGGSRYSMADQKARHKHAVDTKNVRVLDLDRIYDPSSVKGKTVLVTGGNRGLGFGIVQELVAQGADVIVTVRREVEVEGASKVISGIDVQDDDVGEKIVAGLEGRKIDILVNNAGYFMREEETIEKLDFKEELKMINICAVGPLRVTSALYNAGSLSEGARVIIITSQGGSIEWRTTQNPSGHDYGHHMSKAAANMAGKLLAQELQAHAIVTMFHPGFNRTDMTKKYEDVWDEEGAVDPKIGAKRVVHEIARMTKDSNGRFINCEDGLEIPW